MPIESVLDSLNTPRQELDQETEVENISFPTVFARLCWLYDLRLQIRGMYHIAQVHDS